MGKVLFPQALVYLSTGGYPSPRFFPWFLVPDPFPGCPSPRWGERGYSSLRWGGGTPVPDGRGTPVLDGRYPSSRQGVPQSQIGGIPVPGYFAGLWSQVLSQGCPSPRWGNTPVPDGGLPQFQLGGTPVQTRGLQYPPTPSPRDRTAERVLAMLRAVCLLRSRRKTFLFFFKCLHDVTERIPDTTCWCHF